MDIPLVSVLYWKPNSFFALWLIKFRRRDCVQLQPLCLTIEIQWFSSQQKKGKCTVFQNFHQWASSTKEFVHSARRFNYCIIESMKVVCPAFSLFFNAWLPRRVTNWRSFSLPLRRRPCEAPGRPQEKPRGTFVGTFTMQLVTYACHSYYLIMGSLWCFQKLKFVVTIKAVYSSVMKFILSTYG